MPNQSRHIKLVGSFSGNGPANSRRHEFTDSRIHEFTVVRRPGFTLIEVLLALTLVVLFGTLSVLSFTSWRQARALPEGADRVESLIMLARAEAANLGRHLRLEFGADGQMAVEIERNPLEEPGKYSPYLDSAWASELPNDLVRVVRCTLTGSSAYSVLNTRGQEPGELQAITFFPDGSCDSAAIELREADRDKRHAIIEIDALTNKVQPARIMEGQELQDYHADLQKRMEVGQ